MSLRSEKSNNSIQHFLIGPNGSHRLSQLARSIYKDSTEFTEIGFKTNGDFLLNSNSLSTLSKLNEKESNSLLGHLGLENNDFIEIRPFSESEQEVMLPDFEKAISMVKSTPSFEPLIGSLTRTITPIIDTRTDARLGGCGFSSMRAHGMVFLSHPKQKEFADIELAINLAHETGHQALILFQKVDHIIQGDLEKEVYSAVRKTLRPAIQSFHAHVALAFMIQFLDEILEREQWGKEQNYLTKRYLELTGDFELSKQSLASTPFTDLGQQLFSETNFYIYEVTSRRPPWT